MPCETAANSSALFRDLALFCGGAHGHWALVPKVLPKSSDSHKPETSTIPVLAEGLAQVQESRSLSGVRPGWSARAMMIAPGAVTAKCGHSHEPDSSIRTGRIAL